MGVLQGSQSESTVGKGSRRNCSLHFRQFSIVSWHRFLGGVKYSKIRVTDPIDRLIHRGQERCQPLERQVE